MVALVELKQGNLELQHSLSWDAARAGLTVGHVRVDYKERLLANTHSCDTFVPALNDCTLTDVELKWLVTGYRRIENRTIKKSSVIVHLDFGIPRGTFIRLVAWRNYLLQQLILHDVNKLGILLQNLKLCNISISHVH